MSAYPPPSRDTVTPEGIPPSGQLSTATVLVVVTQTGVDRISRLAKRTLLILLIAFGIFVFAGMFAMYLPGGIGFQITAMPLLVSLVVFGSGLAATVIFSATAWALGARKCWVALGLGVMMGIVVQVVFGELLGRSLP